MDLKTFLQWFEQFTYKLIPYLIAAIAIVLILDNPWWALYNLHQYEIGLEIFDGAVVVFFVVELIYKWFRVRNVTKFIRLYWIEILAVFPFYLMFRAYNQLTVIFQTGEEVTEAAQKLTHEAVLIREGELLREQRLLKETELARESRPITRLIRFIQRSFRLIGGRLFITHAAMHHAHKQV